MAKKRYHVADHSQYSVTLKESGIHLAPEVVTLQRAAITAVTNKLTGLWVTTAGGVQYRVDTGVRAEQRALTEAAFGIKL